MKNSDYQWPVPFKLSKRRNGFAPENSATKPGPSFSDSPNGTDAAVGPGTYGHIRIVLMSTTYPLAMTSHDRVKQFYRMGPVPKQINMRRLNGGRTVNICSKHFPDNPSVCRFSTFFDVPEGRSRKHRNLIPAGSLVNLHYLLKRIRYRFIKVNPFTG